MGAGELQIPVKIENENYQNEAVFRMERKAMVVKYSARMQVNYLAVEPNKLSK